MKEIEVSRYLKSSAKFRSATGWERGNPLDATVGRTRAPSPIPMYRALAPYSPAKPVTPSIHHVDLLMSDYQATERFYREVLGWPIMRRSGRGAHGWVDFEGLPPAGVEPLLLTVQLARGTYLAFVKGRPPDYEGDEPHIAVRLERSEDKATLMGRLRDHGVAIEENPGENIAIYDPSGLRIEVYDP